MKSIKPRGEFYHATQYLRILPCGAITEERTRTMCFFTVSAEKEITDMQDINIRIIRTT
jgi:hypothetical protein